MKKIRLLTSIACATLGAAVPTLALQQTECNGPECLLEYDIQVNDPRITVQPLVSFPGKAQLIYDIELEELCRQCESCQAPVRVNFIDPTGECQLESWDYTGPPGGTDPNLHEVVIIDGVAEIARLVNECDRDYTNSSSLLFKVRCDGVVNETAGTVRMKCPGCTAG